MICERLNLVLKSKVWDVVNSLDVLTHHFGSWRLLQHSTDNKLHHHGGLFNSGTTKLSKVSWNLNISDGAPPCFHVPRLFNSPSAHWFYYCTWCGYSHTAERKESSL